MPVLLFQSIKKADWSVGGKSPSNKIADFESVCVSIFSGTDAIACDLIAHTFLNKMCHYNSLLCLFFPVLDLLEPSARNKNHPSMSVVFHNLFVFWFIFCKICYRILSPFLFQHVLSNFFCIV